MTAKDPFLRDVVRAASLLDLSQPRLTPLQCRNRLCDGRMVVELDPLDAARWHCTRCGRHGRILKWRESLDDLSRYHVSCGRWPMIRVFVDHDEYLTMRRVRMLDPEALFALYSAVEVGGAVCLLGPADNLQSLAHSLAMEAVYFSETLQRQALLERLSRRMALLCDTGLIPPIDTSAN